MVGLGPAGPELVTAETLAAIERVGHRFVRTRRHPSAAVVGASGSFDHVYEAEPTFEAVYRRIAGELLAAAAASGEVLYAVPGSPRVLERSVDHLLAAAQGSGADVEVEVHPALSFLDLAWVRLGVDPLEDGVRLVDGHRFAVGAAGERGPLLVAHCHNRRVLSDIKLAVEEPPAEPVTVLQRLGGGDEAIFEVAWSELDRAVEPDHLTSLWVPVLAAPLAGEVQAFAELVARLRRECPWDAEQTHASLTRHLVEEAYELVEAIDGLPPGADGLDPAYGHVEEELGDVLFQVVFHSVMAAEVGAFTLADVARGIREKLVRRHPHVFGDASAELGDITSRWESIKREEKGRASAMDGIPAALPALLHAAKVLRRAESAGHPWAATAAVADGDGADLGDRLLALVAEARGRDVDLEAALRIAANRVADAVRAAEAAAAPPAPA